jgi:hypothetical protein
MNSPAEFIVFIAFVIIALGALFRIVVSASLRSGINTSPGLFTELRSQGLAAKKMTLQSFGSDNASPSNSCASFGRSKLVQWAIDVLAIGAFILIGCVASVSVVFSLFCLSFVSF